MLGKKRLFFLLFPTCGTFPPSPSELICFFLIVRRGMYTAPALDKVPWRILVHALPSFSVATPGSLARTRRANLWPMIDVTCTSVCFPLSQRGHIYFPLYRPAALCWYRAEIWTGVTRAIFLHGLRQWLAKTQQLSSVWKLKYGPEQLTKVFVGDPKELFIFQAQML